MRHFIPLYLLLFILNSCGSTDPNSEIDEGFISDETYTCEEIGWTMEVPRGWEIKSRESLQESTEKGLEMMEENSNVIIDDSGLRHLLNFEADLGNSFLSNIESFPIKDKSEYDANQNMIFELIQEAYRGEGIDFDADKYTERVDQLVFNVIKLELYGEHGETLLTQLIYTRHILDYNFSVTLNYSDEDKKKTLLTSWRSSKFSIRD